MNFNINRLLHLGNKYGWATKSHQNFKILFTDNKGNFIEVDYNNKVIITILMHPKWKKTVLKRTGSFTNKILESIFRNPRVHTPPNIKSEYLIIKIKQI